MTFLTLLQSPTGGPTIVPGVGALVGAGALSGTATVIPRSAGITVPHKPITRRITRVEPAVGIRHPGPLPNLPGMVLEAQAAIEQLPEELQEGMRAVLAPLVLLAQEQSRFNRSIYDQYKSLPSPHGDTHRGGNDNIISGEDPSPLTPFSTGDPGSPQAGASAGPHVHDMSAFLPYLDDADSESRNGFQMVIAHSPRLAALLERILLKLCELSEAVDGARDS